MPRLGYCDAGIEVDGNRLEEYGTQTDGKTVTTWVESEAGKQFAIAFHAFDIDSTLRLGIEMDGKALVNSGALYHPQIMGKKLTVKSVTVAKDVVRHFLFSAMTVTDDENLASPDGISEDFGVIKIAVYRGTSRPSCGPRSFNTGIGLEDSPVHERTKKVASHRISLGKDTPETNMGWGSFTRSPDYPDPVAVFRFLYRSRSFLQAQNLIPPDSPPSQPVDAENVEEVKSEDVLPEEDASVKRERKRAIRRLREQQEEIQRQLAELEENPHPPKRIKTEIKPDPEWATYKICDDGVVDLTAD